MYSPEGIFTERAILGRWLSLAASFKADDESYFQRCSIHKPEYLAQQYGISELDLRQVTASQLRDAYLRADSAESVLCGLFKGFETCCEDCALRVLHWVEVDVLWQLVGAKESAEVEIVAALNPEVNRATIEAILEKVGASNV